MSVKHGVTPTFVQLANKARQLREWTRFGVFEGDSVSYQDLRRKSAYEARHGLKKKIDQIARDQKALNKFYKGVGFPTLPKNHTVSRYWEQKMSRMRKAVERQRPTRGSTRGSGGCGRKERTNLQLPHHEGEQVRENAKSGKPKPTAKSHPKSDHKN